MHTTLNHLEEQCLATITFLVHSRGALLSSGARRSGGRLLRADRGRGQVHGSCCAHADSGRERTMMAPSEQQTFGTYEAYGCRVNALDPEELFDRYAEAGFLYPAKREGLTPFLPRLPTTGAGVSRGRADPLGRELRGADTGGWASVSSWRTTTTAGTRNT